MTVAPGPTARPRSAPAPRASVLLPVRNEAGTIDACLWSLQRQSERCFEIIVVDDGSSDGTRARLALRARRDPRIRVIDNEGSGLVDALNTGLAAARAPVILRMDGDDLAARKRLAIQLAFLDAKPGVTVLGSRVRLFPRAALGRGYREYERWLNGLLSPSEIARALFVEAPLAHPSVAFRRAPVLALGGYRDGPFPEDYDLWLRCREAGLTLAKVPETLLAWRDHPARTSRTSPRYDRRAFARLRARYLARYLEEALRRRGQQLVVWGAGRHARRFVRLLRGEAPALAPACWIDIDPAKARRQVEGAPVLLPAEARGLLEKGALVLGLVTNHGAREEIGAWLEAAGLEAGRDYLFSGT